MIKIRKAVQADCKQILDLVKELAVYEKAPNEVTVRLEQFTKSGFGEQPVWWAFVAEEDVETNKKIIGFALYYIRFSTWKGERIYLEDFVVTDACRGKGVGKMLFETLIEEAKQKQFNAIVWQVLDWNEPAINFYKKYDTKFDGEWLNGCLEITL